MATPEGTRCVRFPLRDGESVHVYSGREGVVLQVRREVPTGKDLLTPSVKAAVVVDAVTALKLASELAIAAGAVLKAQ